MERDGARDLNELHRDRARAESFGSFAEQYDRYRPDFPTELIAELADSKPEQVLDAACGTGKVARPLLARGLCVLGVELDARMGEVARSHGVEVEIAKLEEWDDRGRRFDLVTCGDAWHWMDPERAAAKVATVLRPGGTLARLFKMPIVDEATFEAFEAIYGEIAPGLQVQGRWPSDEPYIDLIATHPSFTGARTKTYVCDRTFTADAWCGFSSTLSDHRRLAPEKLAALLDAIARTIDGAGGVVRAKIKAVALLAQRA